MKNTSVITITGCLTGWAVKIEIEGKAVKSQFCSDEASVKAFITKEL